MPALYAPEAATQTRDPARAHADRQALERPGKASRPPPAVHAWHRAIGNHGVVQLLQQLRGALTPATEPTAIFPTALAGTRTPGTRYPHDAAIARSFGRHTIAGLQAHLGPAASASAAAIDAEAYALGDHVVFSRPPDLRTAAHEAAHAIQQRAGLSLPTRVGRVGDDHERHADAVAERVQAGQSAEPLLDRVAPPGQDLPRSEPVVQRLIRFSYTQWLAQRPATQALVSEFVKDFITPEYQLAHSAAKGKGTSKMADDESAAALLTALTALTTAFTASQTSKDWTACTAPADALVLEINRVLTAYTSYKEDLGSYSNTRADNWKTEPTQQALGILEGLVTDSALADKTAAPGTKENPQQPDIPGIRWSLAKAALPAPLRNLIRDIYTSWRIGAVLDDRSPQAQQQKEKNPKEPATLRSWHMNEQGQLPEMQGAALPANATQLHNHYTATSVKPYEKPANGPIGYAEYTGTGLLNDAHNSKIVLDYMSGIIYLTVTHYQLYDRSDDLVPTYTQRDKSAGSGAHSAWFYIDMTQ